MAVVINPQFAVPGQDAVQRGSYGQMGNVIQGQQPYVANPHPVVFPTHGTRPDFVTTHTPVYSSVYSGATPEQAHFGEIRSSNPYWGVVFTPMPYNDWGPVINATAQRIAQGNNIPVVRMEDVLNTMPRLPQPRRGGGAGPAVQNGSGSSTANPPVNHPANPPANPPATSTYPKWDISLNPEWNNVNLTLDDWSKLRQKGDSRWGGFYSPTKNIYIDNGDTVETATGHAMLNQDFAQKLQRLGQTNPEVYNRFLAALSGDKQGQAFLNDYKFPPAITQAQQMTQAQAQSQFQYPGGSIDVYVDGTTPRTISLPLTQEGATELRTWGGIGPYANAFQYNNARLQLSETSKGQQFLRAANVNPVDTSANWATFGARNLPTIFRIGNGGPVWFSPPSGLGTTDDFANFGNALLRLSHDQQQAYVSQAIQDNPQYTQQILDYLTVNYPTVARP